MILRLTWRNLWRNRRRSFITMTSVTFAVLLAVLMQSFQKGVFDYLVNNVVGFYYGYLQVHRQGYWEEQVVDNSFTQQDSVYNTIKRLPGVKEVIPRLETFILAASGNNSKGCMLAGTDPEKENRLSGIAQKITSGSLPGKNEKAVLLAEGFAKRLKVNAGDTLILFGQGYHGSTAAGKFPIRGIVHFGSPQLNEGLVFLPLEQAMELLGAENQLTSYALVIDDPSRLSAIQASVRKITPENFEVMNWKELMPDIANHIKADGASFYIFTGILYLIIAFGIFGTILMMTAERRYEFGMLTAIGMKKSRLGLILFLESLFITLIGVLAGLLASLPPVIYFNRHPLVLKGEMARIYEQFGFEAIFPTAVDPGIFITQSIIVLVIAFITGLYPVWHISRLDPYNAMKR
ncbi:MAG: ABC transporter permease [Sphingobacteriales bacterium]|nr:ABC transporter permease [Sphingobacteriales bacterium]